MGNCFNCGEIDKKNMFPDAKKTDKHFYKEQLKFINAGKSKLANHILSKIKEYERCGNRIQIDISAFDTTEAERNALRRLLNDKGWGIRIKVRKFDSVIEFEVSKVNDDKIRTRRQKEFDKLQKNKDLTKSKSLSNMKKDSDVANVVKNKSLRSFKSVNINNVQYTLETNNDNEEKENGDDNEQSESESENNENEKSIVSVSSVNAINAIGSGKIKRIYWLLYKMAIADM